jgi:hypothetical protein
LGHDAGYPFVQNSGFVRARYASEIEKQVTS